MMTDLDAYARSYIDTALEAQERLGRPAKISSEDYEEAVARAASAFNDLAQVRQRHGERTPW
jgi:hypothetical protein